MSERLPIHQSNEETFNRRTGLLASGLGGAIFGGTAYGISRVVAGADAADNIGIGVGGTIAAGMGGLIMGIASEQRAEELAREGKRKRALLKAFQASVETSLGWGAAGGISGYEAKGITGAMIGASIGAVIGLGSFGTRKFMVDKAYEEGPLQPD